MSKINLELDVDMTTLRFVLYEEYSDLDEILEYTDERVIDKAQKKIAALLCKRYNKVAEEIFKKADRETIDKFIQYLVAEKQKEKEEEQLEQPVLPL
jgi:hypothetical protein